MIRCVLTLIALAPLSSAPTFGQWKTADPDPKVDRVWVGMTVKDGVAYPGAPDAARRPDPTPVHSIMGGRVVTGDTLVELRGWELSIALTSDVGADRVVNPSVFVDLNKDKLKLDGVVYEASKCLPKMEPHREVLGWYSLNYPVALERDGDVVNLVPLKGGDRAAFLRPLGYTADDKRLLSSQYKHPTMAECREIWKPYLAKWDGKEEHPRNQPVLPPAPVARKDTTPFTPRPAVRVPLCLPKID